MLQTLNWFSSALAICETKLYILLAGEDIPFTELEGSSELLGSARETKRN